MKKVVNLEIEVDVDVSDETGELVSADVQGYSILPALKRKQKSFLVEEATEQTD